MEILLILAEEKTTSKIGRLLYISQSAVNKRINNLENQLVKKLIVPHGKYVSLNRPWFSRHSVAEK